MLPTLVPGEIVTAVRRWRRLRSGDVVVLKSPVGDQWIVKRCQLIGRTSVQLTGDNEQFSFDSRDFGSVAPRDIHWIVLNSSIAPLSP